MPTSQNTSILSEVFEDAPIPRRTLVYFRRRLANRLHAAVLQQFSKLEAESKLTRADLGRRIGRDPAQVTRWLGGGGNWTLETISDLLLGMGCEPTFGTSVLRRAAPQEQTPDPVAALPSAKEAPRPEKIHDLMPMLRARERAAQEKQRSTDSLPSFLDAASR